MPFSALSAPKSCQIVLLGTGTSVGVPVIGCDCRVCQSPDPRHHRTRSSALVRLPAGNLLIDTTPDLRTQLLREKIGRVHAVLYTHRHADHIFGLDDLRIFPKYLGHDLPVYCEPDVEEFIRTAYGYAFDPAVRAFPAGGVPRIEFRRIERPRCPILDAWVTPIPLEHGPTPVLGFRIGDLAYCTDVNRIPDRSWLLLEGVHTLVLDALRFDRHPTHFSFDEAMEVIARVRPQQAYLTHISCRLDPDEARRRMPPHVDLGYDGQTITVPGSWSIE